MVTKYEILVYVVLENSPDTTVVGHADAAADEAAECGIVLSTDAVTPLICHPSTNPVNQLLE